MKVQFKHALLVCTLLLLGGCANIPNNAGENQADPWEKMNRHTFMFNTVLDETLIRPVAVSYEMVTPEPVRNGVSNMVDNLASPASAINSGLQGKGQRAVKSTFRFLVNSTFGVFGIFDVADAIGIPAHHEDFGQTLGVWGVPTGPYLVLPFFGPTTTRDIWRYPAAFYTRPVAYIDHDSFVRDFSIFTLETVDVRYRILKVDHMYRNAMDPYIAVRDGYLQMRESVVYDGEIPESEMHLTELPLEEE